MAPTLEVEANPDSKTLDITVTDSDGVEREHIETDAEILIQNQQFVSAHERPILTLLTLYQREREQSTGADLEDIADTDIEDLPTQ